MFHAVPSQDSNLKIKGLINPCGLFAVQCFQSVEIWLPFVGNHRTFLMTSGMPTSDEFANLWTLSPYCANSVY
jgi:hypothetical protein